MYFNKFLLIINHRLSYKNIKIIEYPKALEIHQFK